MDVRIHFTKMNGAGNDFVVIDNRAGVVSFDEAKLARSLCDRHLGVGADGMLLIGNSENADFCMDYFNADGSYGGMCGNGGRCAARFFMMEDGRDSKRVSFEAVGNIYRASLLDTDVSLEMTRPKNLRRNILLTLPSINGYASFLDTGSPHAVLVSKNVASLDVETIGKAIRFADEFMPQGTNANFIELIDSKTIKMRTYERGVESETLACGTGAVASAIVSALEFNLKPPISVLTKGGEMLHVTFDFDGHGFSSVRLDGSARVVFVGELLYNPDNSRILDLASVSSSH